MIEYFLRLAMRQKYWFHRYDCLDSAHHPHHVIMLPRIRSSSSRLETNEVTTEQTICSSKLTDSYTSDAYALVAVSNCYILHSCENQGTLLKSIRSCDI